MYHQYNANPIHARVGDCVVRAISTVLDQDWRTTYVGLMLKGLEMYDLPNSNAVWGAYLKDKGFKRIPIHEDNYTVEDFAEDHKDGRYVLALQGHAVACIDGDIYDTFNSLNETVYFYWER